jgi:hypothetical protein
MVWRLHEGLGIPAESLIKMPGKKLPRKARTKRVTIKREDIEK